MRKKQLKEACACEGEEATTGIRKIRLDDFNRYCLQLTEEEQDTLSFREVIASMLGTDPKNIGRIRMNDFAYKIEVNGEMNDFDKILDDNKDVLHRLKGADDEEEETSEFDENEWMTPVEMGIAQKMDWSDDYGDEISDEEKMAYFQSKSDMYDVDMENGLVRLKPEDGWFGGEEENNMEDWEKEGYNSEIAYQNRWRDYEPESYEDDDEDEDRDPYSPFNKDY